MKFTAHDFSRNRWPVGLNASTDADSAEVFAEMMQEAERHTARQRQRWERYERAHSLRACQATDVDSEVQPCS